MEDSVTPEALAIPAGRLEGHLADVYRKLDVRSRTELALLLGADAGRPAAVLGDREE